MASDLPPETTALYAAFGALLFRLEAKGVLSADDLRDLWREAPLWLPDQGDADTAERRALERLAQITSSADRRKITT